MDDGASFDELKRRAYSSDDAEAIDARHRLAALEQERLEQERLDLERKHHEEQDAPAPAILELPRSRAVPRWLTVAIGALAGVALVLGTAAATAPRSSLEVFYRAQTAQDRSLPAGPGASSGTERWLGESGGYEVYAYYTPADEICLVIQQAQGATGTCTAREIFVTNGMTLKAGLLTSTGSEYFSVTWGPTGPPIFVSGRKHQGQPGAR